MYMHWLSSKTDSTRYWDRTIPKHTDEPTLAVPWFLYPRFQDRLKISSPNSSIVLVDANVV